MIQRHAQHPLHKKKVKVSQVVSWIFRRQYIFILYDYHRRLEPSTCIETMSRQRDKSRKLAKDKIKRRQVRGSKASNFHVRWKIAPFRTVSRQLCIVDNYRLQSGGSSHLGNFQPSFTDNSVYFSFKLKGNKQKVKDYNQDDVVQLLFSFIFATRKYLSLDSS